MSDDTKINMEAKLDAAAAKVRQAHPQTPYLGIVAGSGLGALGEMVENGACLPYDEIPHLPAPSVQGHSGQLVIGSIEGLPVVVLSGRVHRYEGHPMDDVVFGVRLLARLGVKCVLLSNAAGAIHSWMRPGTLCRIVDHINMMGENPLMGPNIEALGPRFPDMSFVYCPELGRRLDAAAAHADVHLDRGVYAAMAGPSYETPAEIRMLRMMGASVVGMSTVPEAIALRHMGIRVVGLSVVSNLAAGVGVGALDHAEVKEVANEVGPRLLSLIQTYAGILVKGPLD